MRWALRASIRRIPPPRAARVYGTSAAFPCLVGKNQTFLWGISPQAFSSVVHSLASLRAPGVTSHATRTHTRHLQH